MNTQQYLSDIGVLPEGVAVSVRGYLYGLVLSIACTVGAYVAVVQARLGGGDIRTIVVVLAIVQYFVQATYFLHVRRAGDDDRSRAFVAFSGIVAILVVGSLWVMSHLDARMMSSGMQMEYMRTH